MYDVLDQVIANTSNGNRVVSEQHDVNKINIGSVDFDGDLQRRIAAIQNGPWDAAEYGISREQAIANLTAADTPAKRAKVLADLKARALRRASIDTTGGRVAAAFAGKPAWHGLGVVLDGVMTAEEAAKHSGLSAWNPVKVPMSYAFGDERFTSDETFAVIRSDNGAQLGTVGSGYRPITNADGFSFLDGVLAEFGATYESAGSIYGGRQVWMLAHLPKQAFTLGRKDRVEPYVIFVNSHDGKRASWCHPTTVRVECANTMRTCGKDRGKGLCIRHVGNVREKVASAQSALGLAVEGFSEFRQSAEAMTRTPVEPIPYFDGVLDLVLDVTAAEAAAGPESMLDSVVKLTQAERTAQLKRAEKLIAKRQLVLNDVIERYESERCADGRGNAWTAFNAITESADHGKLGGRHVGENRADRRMESVIAGRADSIKQEAYQLVMQQVAAR